MASLFQRLPPQPDMEALPLLRSEERVGALLVHLAGCSHLSDGVKAAVIHVRGTELGSLLTEWIAETFAQPTFNPSRA